MESSYMTVKQGDELYQWLEATSYRNQTQDTKSGQCRLSTVSTKHYDAIHCNCCEISHK